MDENENQEQLDSINAMLDGGSSEVIVDEPVIDSPVIETVTEPVVTAPVVETPAIENEPSIEDSLRAQIMELTTKLNSPVNQVYPAQTAETPVQSAAPAQTPEAPTEFVPGTYLSEDELDQVIDNPKLIAVAIQRAQQDILKYMDARAQPKVDSGNLNQIVQQAVQQQIMVTKAITEFYDANQDLRPYAQFTQYVLAEVEGKALGTGKTYAEIFQETAELTRKRLGLAQPGVKTVERGRVVEQKPAFAGSKKGGNARPGDNKQWFDENAASMLR